MAPHTMIDLPPNHTAIAFHWDSSHLTKATRDYLLDRLFVIATPLHGPELEDRLDTLLDEHVAHRSLITEITVYWCDRTGHLSTDSISVRSGATATP